MMNKRNDDFYMADSFNRLGEIAYCSANAISDCTATAVKGIGTLGSCLNTTTVDTMSWEPMATVSSVDTLSSKVAEMAKSIEALKKSIMHA